MTWPPPYDAHPLDRAWAALDPAVQRQQAAAEARAFYTRPCREYGASERDAERNAVRDELIAALGDAVDDVCPPLPGRPRRTT